MLLDVGGIWSITEAIGDMASDAHKPCHHVVAVICSADAHTPAPFHRPFFDLNFAKLAITFA